MYNTKQRILEASVRLFNANGIDSVRLQQIAEEVGISVGNLAYHFKNKEAIVEGVYEQVFEEFNSIFRQYLTSPTLADFDGQIAQYYRFFLKNHFYLSEYFKTANPATQYHLLWQECVTKMMIQIKSRVQFLVSKGDLLPEAQSGQYEQLAEQIWMALVFFIPRSNMMARSIDEVSYKTTVWNLLKPYFTIQGKQEFTATILPLLYW